MSTQDRNSQKDQKNHDQRQQNPNMQNEQREWDVEPGEKESDPRKQQQNREWEEAQQKQQQNAQNPVVSGNDRNPGENQRNQDPTRRGNTQEEE